MNTIDKQKKLEDTDIMRKYIPPVKPPSPVRSARAPTKKLSLQYPKPTYGQGTTNFVPKLKKTTTMPITARQPRKTKMTLEASPKSRGSVQVKNG